jgi:RNA polymerase sigma factor (TIGR02999 family)
MSGVTQILSQIDNGDPRAAEQLLPLVYEELRKLAALKLAQERPGHTLQATALVHEAYLRLVGEEAHHNWNSRGHFFGAAAEAMRRILVDGARRRQSLKRGGRFQRQDANLDLLHEGDQSPDILAMDEALTALANQSPPAAKLVELRYFVGFTMEEAASALGVSVRTAHRYWTYAKAFLHNAIHGMDNAEGDFGDAK